VTQNRARAGSAEETMTQPQPQIHLVKGSNYRESYANSVQVRANLWDFFISFGLISQTAPDSVSIENFQGIYVSPQQAKALFNILQQNLSQYEAAFGEIRLEPQSPGGAIQ
jgi:flagellar protein FlaG